MLLGRLLEVRPPRLRCVGGAAAIVGKGAVATHLGRLCDGCGRRAARRRRRLEPPHGRVELGLERAREAVCVALCFELRLGLAGVGFARVRVSSNARRTSSRNFKSDSVASSLFLSRAARRSTADFGSEIGDARLRRRVPTRRPRAPAFARGRRAASLAATA